MAEGMFWYVLRAISGKEGKVKEYIDAEIKNGSLHGCVAQVLIPTEKSLQVRNGKRVVKERNYLPGYVLVEAKLVGEIAHVLRSTPNVLGFLPNTDNPTPLREDEVNRILGRIDEMAQESDKAINEKYYHEEGYYSKNTQAENAMAVSLGICLEKNKEKVVKSIVDNIIKNNYHLTCGNQGYRHVFYLLCEYGYVDLALQVLRNPEYPGCL